MKNMISTVLVTGGVFISTIQAHAIEGLMLAIQGTNVVLSWSSRTNETYVVQYRPTLSTDTPWQTLTNRLPAAANTNTTTFIHLGAYGCGYQSQAASSGDGFRSQVAFAELIVGIETEIWAAEGRKPYPWEVFERPPYPWESHLVKSTQGIAEQNEASILLAGGSDLCMGFYRINFPTRVVAWGHNLYQQSNVPPGLTDGVISLAAGVDHSLALKGDGTLAVWGTQFSPPANLNGVAAIAAGEKHFLALRTNGTVVGWGYDDFGKATPPAGLSNVVAIAGGFNHSLVLKQDGTVLGWGDNSYGQITSPAGLSNVVAISAARAYHNLALKSDGTVFAWGRNDSGQATVPAGLSNVVAVSASEEYSLALKENSTVIGWGNNAYGRATPPAGLTNVVAISAGEDHALALKSDGTIVGWGSSQFGQAVAPTGLDRVVFIYAGGFHSLALRLARAPQILNHPQSQTVTAGANVCLSVAASGDKPLSYQWRFNGTDISGATGTNRCWAVQAGDGGDYSVKVSNDAGEVVSATAVLTVLPP